MAKQEHIDNLPQGPWLSEDELQAILHTDADAEFERIMAAKQRKSIVRLLWPVGVAAAVALLVVGGWMAKDVGDEKIHFPSERELCPSVTESSPSETKLSPSETEYEQPVQTKTTTYLAVNKQPTLNDTDKSPTQMDTCVEDILMEADMAFDHADRVCEGMIIAADCEFETEENEDDASVIYI